MHEDPFCGRGLADVRIIQFRASQHATLAVAGVAYDLDVVAQRSLRDPQQPGIGRVVERAELERLPVTVRNYLAFSLTTPAAAPDRTPQQGASRTFGLSFAGQRARCGHLP